MNIHILYIRIFIYIQIWLCPEISRVVAASRVTLHLHFKQIALYETASISQAGCQLPLGPNWYWQLKYAQKV